MVLNIYNLMNIESKYLISIESMIQLGTLLLLNGQPIKENMCITGDKMHPVPLQ